MKLKLYESFHSFSRPSVIVAAIPGDGNGYMVSSTPQPGQIGYGHRHYDDIIMTRPSNARLLTAPPPSQELVLSPQPTHRNQMILSTPREVIQYIPPPLLPQTPSPPASPPPTASRVPTPALMVAAANHPDHELINSTIRYPDNQGFVAKVTRETDSLLPQSTSNTMHRAMRGVQDFVGDLLPTSPSRTSSNMKPIDDYLSRFRGHRQSAQTVRTNVDRRRHVNKMQDLERDFRHDINGRLNRVSSLVSNSVHYFARGIQNSREQAKVQRTQDNKRRWHQFRAQARTPLDRRATLPAALEAPVNRQYLDYPNR